MALASCFGMLFAAAAPGATIALAPLITALIITLRTSRAGVGEMLSKNGGETQMRQPLHTASSLLLTVH